MSDGPTPLNVRRTNAPKCPTVGLAREKFLFGDGLLHRGGHFEPSYAPIGLASSVGSPKRLNFGQKWPFLG